MTKEKYAELNRRLEAIERLILGHVRAHRGGKYVARLLPHTKRITSRRRLDAL